MKERRLDIENLELAAGNIQKGADEDQLRLLRVNPTVWEQQFKGPSRMLSTVSRRNRYTGNLLKPTIHEHAANQAKFLPSKSIINVVISQYDWENVHVFLGPLGEELLEVCSILGQGSLGDIAQRPRHWRTAGHWCRHR
jgi:hypothetical protein